MYDVVAIGEALIDFTPMGSGPMGNPGFEMNPGGAPANCLASNAALGGKTAFIGMVGEDTFGDAIVAAMGQAGIDTAPMRRHKSVHTTLAFVSLKADGERNFDFLRNPGADIMLEMGDVDFSVIDNCRMLHFGSLSMTDDPVRDTLFKVLEHARAQNIRTSYDPNYRPPLWQDEKTAVEWMKKGLSYANMVKMSQEEMALLTGVGEDELKKGAQMIMAEGPDTVFITCGGRGAYYATADEEGMVPGFDVKAVDTTGCGDAFTGAVHYFLLNRPDMQVCQVVRLANAVGALCATQSGGLPAIPTRAALEDFLRQIGEEAI